MADSAGEKSFDATPHRRQEAREQGQVAFSQDLGSAATLMIGASLILMMGGALIDFCARLMKHYLGDVADLHASQETMMHDWVGIAISLATVLLPMLGLMMLGGAASSVLQVGF